MKKTYEQPIVEVMDARVEKGFVGSGNNAPQGKGGDQMFECTTTYMFN